MVSPSNKKYLPADLAKAAQDRAEERGTTYLEGLLDIEREDAGHVGDAWEEMVKEQIHDCGGTAGGR